MANEISNADDVIDSRDVIARIKELEADEARDEVDDEDLSALKELAEEAEQYAPDWQYGEALIRDSYFVEHAQETAESIGAIDPNASWPLTFIDWEAAANALRMDYTSVEFDGVTYWVR